MPGAAVEPNGTHTRVRSSPLDADSPPFLAAVESSRHAIWRAANSGANSGIPPDQHRPRRRRRGGIRGAALADECGANAPTPSSRVVPLPRAPARATRFAAIARDVAERVARGPRAAAGSRARSGAADVLGATVAAGAALLDLPVRPRARARGRRLLEGAARGQGERPARARADLALSAPAPVRPRGCQEGSSRPRSDGKPASPSRGRLRLEAQGDPDPVSPGVDARGAQAPAPARGDPASAKEGTKSSKDLTGVNTGVLAGVVATGLRLSTTSDKDFTADTASKPGEPAAPASKPAAPTAPAGASDAAANAADAQRWIDDWSRGRGRRRLRGQGQEAQGWIDAWKKSGGGADTPEGRAKEAQAWIDAWKK